ncbi:glycoside hydrolase superfamily [Colletotrichum phormii]|uniref:chitinase n=1 Tax=Colletotrichum phormii TaxID=359342 RepID=A0AAJ0EH32_9PEZI|nr:glycoside hydrolase superfamily [Colletotrichum phormii]KAK1636580.1 glycoside hydrolase superfamily [Colletotrichum phormii]
MIGSTLLLPLLAALASVAGAVPVHERRSVRPTCGKPGTVVSTTQVTIPTSSQAAGTTAVPTSPPAVSLPSPSGPAITVSSSFLTSSRPASPTSAGVPVVSSSVRTSAAGSSAAAAPSSLSTNPKLSHANSCFRGVYGANYQPADIPADKVTHLLYSFADIQSDGTVVSSDPYSDTQRKYSGDDNQDGNAYGCVKQLYALKKQNRQLKLVLSIGGWTWSSKFPAVAASDTARKQFASSAIKLMIDWGFDGLDIDWEYPASDTEATNFVALLKEVRSQLDAYAAANANGYHFALTIACPAGPSHYQQMNLRGMDPYVDAWHLMAYDYAGSWDTTTGHQANLYQNPTNPTATKFDTQTALTYYLSQGIASNKIVLGLPLYGRSFENTANGIGLPYSGVGTGSIEPGVWHYKVLPKAGAVEIYDSTAGALYSYDSSTKELISYDNPASAGVKAQYLLDNKLGGAVFWEAAGDRKGEGSLVGVLASKMGKLDSNQNLLSYPNSQYANIKSNLA